MQFSKYQHVERLGTADTDGLLDGKVYVYSKIDGSNVGIFLDENNNVCVNSRNRIITLADDNHGCCNFVLQEEKFKKYLEKHPNHYLYGEYLVRHSIRYYEDDAWNKVYIFDIIEEDENGSKRYLSYEEYVPLLDEFDIPYIPCIKILYNPSIDDIIENAKEATYLTKDNQIGEGVVAKRYDFVNQFNRIVWGKYVFPKFKNEKIEKPKECIELKIIEKYVTKEFIDKEVEKFKEEVIWQSKLIPRLLETIWHTFITEEIYNIIKDYKAPTINFKTLKKLYTDRFKQLKGELF